MTKFSELADRELVAWKQRTTTLGGGPFADSPYSKRPGGPAYAVCLPIESASLNLLPDARDAALDRFERLGIRWHDGTPAGPSNHLRSSQVQCVNALMPFIDDPGALAWLFGEVLPIERVVPFGDPAAPDDHVVFEWIGLHDYLNEGSGKARTRGANTTSADAAIRYRTPGGTTEIALVEWKYTESYRSAPKSPQPATTATRTARYEPLWRSVVRTDLLPIQELFVEPIYQLLRQQMLAHEMELARELDAECIRVCHAAPVANAALTASLPTASLREVRLADGRPPANVWALWDSLRLEPDRFVRLDTARFAAPDAPTSPEFKDRYGHLVQLPDRASDRVASVGRG